MREKFRGIKYSSFYGPKNWSNFNNYKKLNSSLELFLRIFHT
jgi:hypothetical protein